MNSDYIRIGEAAKLLDVTIQTLRNWEASGKLIPVKSSGGHRYYKKTDIMHHLLDIQNLGLAWATSAQIPNISDDYYCDRQDRFASRLENMTKELLLQPSLVSNDSLSLVTLVAGEIGDNVFAHNMGSWVDLPGLFYAYDLHKRIIVIADRGQGVRETISRVRPRIRHDIDALNIAFTEIISGRAPEKRGNGLKVVRNVAESYPIGLIFQSGTARIEIPKEPGSMSLATSDRNVRGTYSVIMF